VLNPIDVERVIRDRQVCGVFPTEIHEGVAWWVASCFVVTVKTSRLAVAYDGREATEEFRRRFHKGAVNAQHWACHVHDLGTVDENELLATAKELHAPAAYLTTALAGDDLTATIRLYDTDGQLLDEDTGLARIRDMIADNHVPIPVNEQAKGRIEDSRSLPKERS
jgi:phosphomannomutase